MTASSVRLMYRTLLIVLIAAGTAAVIAAVIVVTQLVRQQEQLEYERCLAVLGFTPENTGDDLDALIEAADYCSSR